MGSRFAGQKGGHAEQIGYCQRVDDWEVAWTSDFGVFVGVGIGKWDFVFRSETAGVTQPYTLRGAGIGAGLSSAYKALAPMGRAGEAADTTHQVVHNALNAGHRGPFWPTTCYSRFSAHDINWTYGDVYMAQGALYRGKKAMRLRLFRFGGDCLCRTAIIPKGFRGIDASASAVTGLLVMDKSRPAGDFPRDGGKPTQR